MGSNPTSSSDASIALEGVGLIGICLSKALTTVQQSSDTYQIDSAREPLVNKWRLAMLDLNITDVERIKDAFGKGVLTSQKDDAKLDLHGDVVGLSDHYNRVGQNWRLLGNQFRVEERQRNGLADTEVTYLSHRGARPRNGKFLRLEEVQVLVYGDK